MTNSVRYHCYQCKIYGMDIADVEHHKENYKDHTFFSEDWENLDR